VSSSSTVRHTWSESDRFVPRAFVRPIQRLMGHEAAGGLVMLVAAVVAVIWANSPWQDAYFDLWSTHLVVELGDVLRLDHLTLQHWVNDALMTAFFLMVGLEIKREVVHGELGNLKAVALPIIAAAGGMLVPAGIFAVLTAGHTGSEGWGIPMATDIAFAVGVVSLAGRRVPLAAKIFLLTLAVADDIGAIIVIAVFYTSDLSAGWFAVALLALLAAFALKRMEVHALAPYLAVGFVAWLGLLESGVHATLAGVALGLMTPAWPLRSPVAYPEAVQPLVDQVGRSTADEELTHEELVTDEHAIGEVIRASQQTLSPLDRIERAISPWVTFAVVPIFALANAGVEVTGDTLSNVFSNRVTLGVMLGLVVGKTVGIFGFTFIATKLGLGNRPTGATWRHMFGVAVCGGIGFTVALFVTSISLDDPAAADSAKLGILLGSTIAGIAGYLLLKTAPEPAEEAAAG